MQVTVGDRYTAISSADIVGAAGTIVVWKNAAMLEKVSVKILVWIVLLNRDAFCEDFSDNGLSDQLLHLILLIAQMFKIFRGKDERNYTDQNDADAKCSIARLDRRDPGHNDSHGNEK